MPIASVPLPALVRTEVPPVCIVTGSTAEVAYQAVTLEFDPSKATGRGSVTATAQGSFTPDGKPGPTRVTAMLPFTADGLKKFQRSQRLLWPIVLAGFAAGGLLSWGLWFLHPWAGVIGFFVGLFVLPMWLASTVHDRWGVALRGVVFGRAVIEMPSAAAAAEIEKKFGPLPTGESPAQDAPRRAEAGR